MLSPSLPIYSSGSVCIGMQDNFQSRQQTSEKLVEFSPSRPDFFTSKGEWGHKKKLKKGEHTLSKTFFPPFLRFQIDGSVQNDNRDQKIGGKVRFLEEDRSMLSLSLLECFSSSILHLATDTFFCQVERSQKCLLFTTKYCEFTDPRELITKSFLCQIKL